MTPAASTVIAYARVSTEEQGEEGISLDAQEYAMDEYAKARGWNIVHMREVASGTTMAKRPVVREALAMLDEGKAQAIIVTKLDRLSRSAIDAIQTLDRAGHSGWDLVIMDLGIDTTTAMGKAMFTVSAAFAQLYRDQISDNTKAALAQKRRQGVVLGRPRADRAVKRPEEAVRMRIALARLRVLRAEGLSYRKIAAALNAEGIKGSQGGSWHDVSVMKALRRYGMDDAP